MKTIEQLQAEQSKAIRKLQAEHNLAALMPLPPSTVMADTLTGSPWVSYKVEGIRGALEVLKAFTVVPFSEYRDGCCSLKPMELIPEAKRDTNCAQWALSLDVSTHFFSRCGAGTNVKVVFFARIPTAGLVRITLDITGPGYIGSFNQLGATCQIRKNQVVRGSVQANRALDGATTRYIKWASGGDDWASFSYLVPAEYADMDQPAETLKEALNCLLNLSDEFDAKVTK